ncbi:MAG: archaeoflavoprotein AfpA [Candidatus Bathyarchaeia archaeon]
MKSEFRTKRRVAWGITGSGDKLMEAFGVLKEIKEAYSEEVEIEVFLSRAGEQVAKYYRLSDELRESFRVWVEKDANTPFLAGRLQLGQFEFLLIAPATSNTVAKLSYGISDTMLTNGAIQAMKALVPVYIMPVDYREGTTVTKLPDGRDLRIRVRKEDAENVGKLDTMDGITPFEKPEEIKEIFEKYFSH